MTTTKPARTWTAIEVADLCGQRCNWIVPLRNTPGAGDIMVTCRIKDARIAFGHVQVLIFPTEGHGSRWVNLDAVELI